MVNTDPSTISLIWRYKKQNADEISKVFSLYLAFYIAFYIVVLNQFPMCECR